jgi:hypothetical protein
MPVVSFTSLEDNNTTARGALKALSQNQWLHLACHVNLRKARRAFIDQGDHPISLAEPGIRILIGLLRYRG